MKFNLLVAPIWALATSLSPPDPPAARSAGHMALAASHGQATPQTPKRSEHTGARSRNLILFVGEGLDESLPLEAFEATTTAEIRRGDGGTGAAPNMVSAIMTGAKTRNASIGLDAVVTRGQCQEARGHEIPSLLETAKDAGLAAGVVTTGRITRVGPASAYAHVSDPDWEADSEMPSQAAREGCRDIARQLVEFDHHGGLDVVMGGGRLAFLTQEQSDPQQPDRRGVRTDGVDLISGWRDRHPEGRYLWSSAQLADAARWPGGPILGLFSPEDLASTPGDAERDSPTLAEMTRAAIAVLERAPKGYALLVDVFPATADRASISRAVATAAAMTRADDTLIVVVADHGGATAAHGPDASIQARGPGAETITGILAPEDLNRSLRASWSWLSGAVER